ncbi:hypothetical protein BJ912DRAFT_160020 [Pholiota molesta]|nr:hypothetical protein BJ912DRAFT_160020 [Pholiota molesta]
MLSTTTTGDFVAIPPELQIRILQNLDAVSLARCAMTCVYLNDLVRNASQLIYILHLYWDGLKACGTALPTADAVARLLHRRHAWLSLAWTESVTATIPFSTCSEAWDVVGGAVASVDDGMLEIIQLPTAGNDKGRTIRRAFGSTPCLTMDPTQDLLLFVENVPNAPGSMLNVPVFVARIHVRTICSGAPHPLALQGSLEFKGESFFGYLLDDSMDPVLQISHNLVALSFAPSHTRILIWDWTTAELLLDSLMSFDRSFSSYMNGCALNFLDSDHFLFACADGSGSLRLYKLDRTVSIDNGPAIHLATLHLPTLRAAAHIRQISFLTPAMQAHPRPHPTLATTDDPEARLHLLQIMYFCGDEGPSDEGQSGLLFLHQRVLTKYIAQHARLGGPALNIPWEEWGPRNTRLISPGEGLANTYDKRYIHGQRAAFACSGVPSADIDVFDFSLAAVLSAKGCIPAPIPSGTIWDLSLSTRVGPLHDCPFFADNFSTYLPYVHIMRGLALDYTGVIVYADGLVCTNGLSVRL